tara:strand:+ start:359 stop:820 length:462 start_codon:yes stop_codon:yes gene_type:complete
LTITSSNITEDNINLLTYETVGRLVLTYGELWDTTYIIANASSTDITITKEDLGLTSLSNIYFKVEVAEATDVVMVDSAVVGLYDINVENNNSSKLYQANNLKHELDNLNYYDGIVEALTAKEEFQGANEMFYNFITFLETFYGNNHLDHISR